MKLNKNKPIYALAPMAGFTDSVFRRMCRRYGADVVYSEMASAAALTFAPDKTLEMLYFSKNERPYIAQLFGSEPKHFATAAKLFTERGIGGMVPDGIDINFGCPVKKVAKQGAGAVLMNNPKKAREIVKSVLDSTDLPVSIKARSKVGKVDVLHFLDGINDLDIKAVMIHGRTRAQGLGGPVDSLIIKKARDYFSGLILANGGVKSRDDAIRLLDESGADGIGIARGALGRPWIFKAVGTGQSVERSRRAIFKESRRHARLAQEAKGERGIVELRKHLMYYVQGLPGAGELRQRLVKVETLRDVRRILKD